MVGSTGAAKALDTTAPHINRTPTAALGPTPSPR